MADSYRCNTCGELHEGLPFSWGAVTPSRVDEIPEDERDRRIRITSDQCIVDGSEFFILGRIEIPVVDSDRSFYWLAWVLVSEVDFERISELWETQGRESEPPYPCRLGSNLPYEKSTINLAAKLMTSPVGDRPLVYLDPDEHPLAIEQRDGITTKRVQEIAEQLIH